jgi:hypothetical protein
MVDPVVLRTWWQVRSPRQRHGLACVLCARPFVSAGDWRRAAPRPVALSGTGSPLLACVARGCAALCASVDAD